MKKTIILFIILSQLFLKTTSDYNKQYIKTEDMPSSGIIEINRIKLKKEFVKNRDVDYGISMIEPSEFPDVNNSVLILIGHSGTGKYSYFNDLYKLKVGDVVVIYYDNKKYYYSLLYYYYEEKDGLIKIDKLKNTNSLVLVTCTNNNKKLQTVYVFKINSK